MEPHQDIQLIFIKQTPITPLTVEYKVEVPEDVKKKIEENMKLFMRDRPYHIDMEIKVTVKYES